MITQKRVKELFGYVDGNLIRKTKGKYSDIGDVIGSPTNGYLSVRIGKRKYRNHRLIWLYHFGYMPENGIDHTDRNKLNNKIENLREVSQSCNLRNTGNISSNTSGIKGVYWNKRDNKWAATIKINNTKFSLGYHSSFTEAVFHRFAAEQCVDWALCGVNTPAEKYVIIHMKKCL